MDSTTRWALKDCPHVIKFKPQGEKIHPEIKYWFELSAEDAARCLMIKSAVKSILPEAKIYLFGSRINGRWTEESDYDICVLWMATPKERETLKQHNFGFRVDFRFSHSFNVSKCVEI